MYEEVSRAPNHFSVVLFLRRCKSTAETKAKQSFSHNFPEKPVILGKIGHFLGKSKKKKKRELKSKEKGKNHSLSPKKSLIFSQRWEKSWESWEKCLIKIKKASPSPSMKKMLLTKSNQSYPNILFPNACNTIYVILN